MLKDKIFNIIKKKEEKLFFNMKGNLKVFGFDKDKRLIHIDNGSNVITSWAKQAFMKNFGGIPYLAINTTDATNVNYKNATTFASATHNDSPATNLDGTVVSSKGYFSDVSIENLKGNKGSAWDDAFIPNFPTKMLFGTGVELNYTGSSYNLHFSDSIPVAWNNAWWDKFISYEGDGTETNIKSTTYGANGATNNLYSDVYSTAADANIGRPSAKSRTLNTLDSTIVAQVKNTFLPTSTGIAGAIKNNDYTVGLTYTPFSTNPTNQVYIFNPAYKGVGNPAFVYIDRSSLDSGSASNIYINRELSTNEVSNRITFQVTMPNQSSGNYYYPYNGFYLREAGLFSDARHYVDTTTTSNKVPVFGVDTNNQVEDYNKMLFGTMLAKRRIATIFKSFDNSYTFQWTLYVE